MNRFGEYGESVGVVDGEERVWVWWTEERVSADVGVADVAGE